ncbi:MAG: DUF1761 domain-containing protein [Rhodobacteraceae bacterium]|nr:DUF1761 domain-containing protein [Paracoccaceae bacterium]
MIENISWLAAILCVVAATIIGGLWYAPFLLGKAWMAELGKTPEQLGNPAEAIITSMIMNLIAGIVLQIVMDWRGVETLSGALSTAAIVWIGFTGSMSLMHDRYHGARLRLTAINAGNTLLSFLAMGAVIYFVA